MGFKNGLSTNVTRDLGPRPDSKHKTDRVRLSSMRVFNRDQVNQGVPTVARESIQAFSKADQ